MKPLPLGTKVECEEGRFLPICAPCSYRGTPQANAPRARASLAQHACGNAHRRTVRRKALR